MPTGESQEKELLRIAESERKGPRPSIACENGERTGTGKEMIGKVENDRNEYAQNNRDRVTWISSRLNNGRKSLLTRCPDFTEYIHGNNCSIFISSPAELCRAARAARSGSPGSTIINSHEPSCLLAALGFSFVSGILIIRSITSSPIKKTVAMAETMAGGDFTARLPIKKKDEIGIMATAMDFMAGTTGHDDEGDREGHMSSSGTSSDMTTLSRQLSLQLNIPPENPML